MCWRPVRQGVWEGEGDCCPGPCPCPARCCPTSPALRSGVAGTIDARKWKSASEWLVPNAQIPAAQTLEPHLWALDSKFMVGHDVAAVMRREVREAAAVVTNTRGGRRPVLVVITIGDSQLGAPLGAGGGGVALALGLCAPVVMSAVVLRLGGALEGEGPRVGGGGGLQKA